MKDSSMYPKEPNLRRQRNWRLKNLPVNFARMVADADKDIMAENIERFKAEYMKAIESGLSERLKGVPPKISREKEI